MNFSITNQNEWGIPMTYVLRLSVLDCWINSCMYVSNLRLMIYIFPTRYKKEKKITLQEWFIAHVTANLLFINSLFWNKDCLGSSCPKSLILFKSWIKRNNSRLSHVLAYGTQRAKISKKVHKPLLAVNVILFELNGFNAFIWVPRSRSDPKKI